MIKKILVLGALAAIFAIPAFAQDSGKDDLFAKIVKLSQDKKPEKKAEAYKLSEEFLAKYGKDDKDEKVKKIADFAERYRYNELNVALDKGNYDDAFELGKALLEKNPDDTYVTMNLAYAGFDAMTKKNDKGYADASISYAKKTLELLEAGKLPKTFNPFKNQQEATAWMHYSMGNLQLEFDPAESALNIYKSFKYESTVKTNPYAYYLIAAFYEGQYRDRAKEFDEKHGKKAKEDAEMKADTERLNKLLDLMIDTYARAVKLSDATNPNTQVWTNNLTNVYKFRKGSDAGLADVIANALSTPIAEPKAL